MKKLTKNWIQAAYIDLVAIEKMLDSDILTGVIAFHAQQCIEKILKALINESGKDIPRIHKLISLLGSVENKFNLKVDPTIMRILDTLYIDSRYPGSLGLLPNGAPSLKEAREFYDFAQGIYEKVNQLLI
jgi:HEPN domain-containing protein